MKKVIILIIILIVIGGIVLFLTKKAGPEPSAGVIPGEEKAGTITPQKTTTPEETLPVDPDILLKSQLEVQARSFIERYGSYSSDSDWENLKGLAGMMSEKLKAETEPKMTSPSEDLAKEGDFYGLTTRVISIELGDFDPSGFAEFFASAQSQETIGTITNVLYKNVELTFVKETGGWKVEEIKIE